jgi:hypothetical protein
VLPNLAWSVAHLPDAGRQAAAALAPKDLVALRDGRGRDRSHDADAEPAERLAHRELERRDVRDRRRAAAAAPEVRYDS